LYYRKHPRRKVSNASTSALYAHPAEGIPFADLVHLPELYPFKKSISVDILRRDDRFEVHHHGGGLEMVVLQKQTS
jgi:hypothetical protein